MVHGPKAGLQQQLCHPFEEAEPLQHIEEDIIAFHSFHHSPFVHLTHLYIHDLPTCIQNNTELKCPQKDVPSLSPNTSQNFRKKDGSEEA